ncbi:MAG: ferritin family protein, partial [Planctomycetota bacterium]
MEKFGSVDEILDFAVEKELEANQFYTELAEKMENPAMRKVFQDFAAEEMGHKAKLEAVKAGDYEVRDEQVASLGIADYVVVGEPQPDMNYADALVLAMKK